MVQGFIIKKCTTRNICVVAIAFAVLTLFFLCFCRGIPGNDFWWHVKVGEWICENKTVPTKDIFSWYGIANGLDWTAHEWLSDVVFYVILNTTGELGVYLFSVAAAFLMMALIWNEVKSFAEKNLIFSGFFFLMLPFVLHAYFYGRPQIFSFFLLFFELKILFRFIENPESKFIYFIPLISCFWSNFHGGSSNLSYLLCIVFLVSGLLPENMGRLQTHRLSKKAMWKLIAVTTASFMAIAINPNGFDMITYPYANMADTLMLSLIDEWSAPDAKNFSQLIFYFAPIFVMTIGFVSENKRIRVIDALIMLVFLFLFFRSLRFIMLWYIASAFYAFRYLPEFELRFIKNGVKVILSIFVILICFGLVCSCVSSFNVICSENKLIKTVLEDEMIDFVKEESPERLYNDYNYGESLIYNDIPVFYDARADIYAADHILADGASFMRLIQMNESADDVFVDPDVLINKFGFDGILIGRGRPLYGYLRKFPQKYELVYEAGNSAYFRVYNNTES